MNFDKYDDAQLKRHHDELTQYKDKIGREHEDRVDCVDLIILLRNEHMRRELLRQRPVILFQYQAQKVCNND